MKRGRETTQTAALSAFAARRLAAEKSAAAAAAAMSANTDPTTGAQEMSEPEALPMDRDSNASASPSMRESEDDDEGENENQARSTNDSEDNLRESAEPTHNTAYIHASRAFQVTQMPELMPFVPKVYYGDEPVIVLGLARDEAISLQGVCLFEVLEGSIGLLGARLTADRRRHPLACPRTTARAVVRALSHATVPQDYFDEDVVALVAFTPARHGLAHVLAAYATGRQCFPRNRHAKVNVTFGPTNGAQGTVTTGASDPGPVTVALPRSWRSVLDAAAPLVTDEDEGVVMQEDDEDDDEDDALDAPHEMPAIDIAVLVGPKNSGKSTLGRHLRNRLLTRMRATEHAARDDLDSGQDDDRLVWHLDLDPGQPEFTPPGLLSAKLLTKPCFAMAAAFNSEEPGESGSRDEGEHAEPDRMHWLGDTSPKEDPARYVACAEDLVRHIFEHSRQLAAARSNYGSVPHVSVVVNTPGWVKGLGLELLHAVVRVLETAVDSAVGADAIGLPAAYSESSMQGRVRVLQLGRTELPGMLEAGGSRARVVALEAQERVHAGANARPDRSREQNTSQQPPQQQQQQQQQDRETPHLSAADARTVSVTSYLHRLSARHWQHGSVDSLDATDTRNLLPHGSVSSADEGSEASSTSRTGVPTRASGSLVSLSTMPAYTVPFERGLAGVHFPHHTTLPARDAAAALNGTLVALVVASPLALSQVDVDRERDSHQGREEGAAGLPIIRPRQTVAGETWPHPSTSRCLGAALVRGVDLVRGTLELVMPVSEAALAACVDFVSDDTDAGVDEGGDDKNGRSGLVLVSGGIEVPAQLLLAALPASSSATMHEHEHDDDATRMALDERPYVTTVPGRGVGWQSWHVRRNIGRRVRQ